MSNCVLSTGRLCLRKWKDSDTAPFIEMNKDPEVMRYFPTTLSDKETLHLIKRINSQFDENGFGLFAVEHKESKSFIGFTGFAVPRFQHFFTPCVEIGWRFKKDYWKQGLATEAAIACLKYGFEALQLDSIVSFTSKINKPSEKLMQRIGMEYLNDFNHPTIEKGDPLCKHVLYKIKKENYPH